MGVIQAQTHAWSSSQNVPPLIASDLDGGYFAVYNYSDSINVDQVHSGDYHVPTTDYGVAIARFDADGTLLFAKYLEKNLARENMVLDLKVLPDGSFYTVGSARILGLDIQVDLDPSSTTEWIVDQSSLYIAHYDSNGLLLSAEDYYMDLFHFQYFGSFVTPTNGIVLSGIAPSFAHFSDDPMNADIPWGGEDEQFLVAFDSSLDMLWLDHYINERGPAYSSFERCMTTQRANGNMIVAQTYIGNVTLSTGESFSSAGGYDILISEYDMTGTIVEAYSLHSPQVDDYVYAMSFDSQGNLYIAYHLTQSVDIDIKDTYAGESIAQRMIIAKYDSDFDLLTFIDANPGNTDITGFQVNSADELVMYGRLFSSFDFDFESGGDDFYKLESAGGWGYDIYLAKYNSDLVVQYAHNIGTDSNGDNALSLMVNESDDMFITGSFPSGSMDMDFGPLTDEISSSVSYTPFVSKYEWCSSQYYDVPVSVCRGRNYTFPDGQFVFQVQEDVSHSVPHVGINSCDSTIVYHLEVLEEDNTTETITVCYGANHVYPDGSTETNVTSEKQHVSFLVNHNGCDSVVTTIISVLEAVAETEEMVSLCPGEDYVYPDGSTETNITTNEEHLSYLTNQNGCDSLVMTSISVLESVDEDETIEVCYGSNYTFADGTEIEGITTDMVHVSYLQNEMGCEYALTSSVQVGEQYITDDAQEVCLGGAITFPDGTMSSDIQSAMTHSSVLESVTGCDSTIVTTVSVVAIQVAVDFMDGILTSTEGMDSYQWIDCTNGMAQIEGETSQTFGPSVNGSYAVMVSSDGCSVSSDCVSFTVSSLSETSPIEGLTVGPNPTDGALQIQYQNGPQEMYVSVVDITGRIIFENDFGVADKALIQLVGETGVYLVRVSTGFESTTQRILLR